MDTRLASLEAALAQLAFEFAERLLAAAVSAPVNDLAALLRDGGALERELAHVVEGALRAPSGPRPANVRPWRPSSTPAVPARRGAAMEAQRATRPKARPRAPLASLARHTPAALRAPAPSRAPRGHARFDEVEEDGFANAITDPSRLLEVLGDLRPAAERAAAPETELLQAYVPTTKAAEQGPALRPGESLQRTARGGVVLRRGAR